MFDSFSDFSSATNAFNTTAQCTSISAFTTVEIPQNPETWPMVFPKSAPLHGGDSPETDQWEEVDMYREADWYPESVEHFLRGPVTRGPPPNKLTAKIRKHLACLGWRIEQNRGGASSGCGQSKFRYTSPTRHRRFSTLRLACHHLIEPRSSSAGSDNVDVEASGDEEEEEDDDEEEEEEDDDDDDDGFGEVFDFESVPITEKRKKNHSFEPKTPNCGSVMNFDKFGEIPSFGSVPIVEKSKRIPRFGSVPIVEKSKRIPRFGSVPIVEKSKRIPRFGSAPIFLDKREIPICGSVSVVPNVGDNVENENLGLVNRFVGSPRYDPESVVEWIKMANGAGRMIQSKSEVSSRVKNHLLFIGWDLYYIVKACPDGVTREELRYRAPPPHSSRAHNSLINACNFLVKEGLVKFDDNAIVFQSRPESTSSRVVKRKIGLGHNIFGIGTQGAPQHPHVDEKIGDNSRILERIQGNGNVGEVGVLEGKRMKVQVVGARSNARTMTGQLIESKLVEDMAEVYYRNRKGDGKLKEGWVTREGIKCRCCQNVFALSKFEAHAGSTNHRPAANIILPDGRSLSELHNEFKAR